MGAGITVLFLLFELVPSLIKLLLPQTEYDEILNKRRRLNIRTAKAFFLRENEAYESRSDTDEKTAHIVAVEELYQSLAR